MGLKPLYYSQGNNIDESIWAIIHEKALEEIHTRSLAIVSTDDHTVYDVQYSYRTKLPKCPRLE